MFEPFRITRDRQKDYPVLLRSLEYLVRGEKNRTARFANAAALLNWFLEDINWVGFYFTENDRGDLVLGPFQGLPACVRIPCGKGVCGKAVAAEATQLVPDVFAFPGHIACDSVSRSELVVPLKSAEQEILGVLDIDSPSPARFDRVDAEWMEKAAALLGSGH